MNDLAFTHTQIVCRSIWAWRQCANICYLWRHDCCCWCAWSVLTPPQLSSCRSGLSFQSSGFNWITKTTRKTSRIDSKSQHRASINQRSFSNVLNLSFLLTLRFSLLPLLLFGLRLVRRHIAATPRLHNQQTYGTWTWTNTQLQRFQVHGKNISEAHVTRQSMWLRCFVMLTLTKSDQRKLRRDKHSTQRLFPCLMRSDSVTITLDNHDCIMSRRKSTVPPLAGVGVSIRAARSSRSRGWRGARATASRYCAPSNLEEHRGFACWSKSNWSLLKHRHNTCTRSIQIPRETFLHWAQCAVNHCDAAYF